jgi:hypothetical protein
LSIFKGSYVCSSKSKSDTYDGLSLMAILGKVSLVIIKVFLIEVLETKVSPK